MKTVVVLAGGYSTEHQISLASGRTAEAAFIEAGYKVLFVVLKKDGFWLKDQLIKLTDLSADFVFNVIHGTLAKTGTSQECSKYSASLTAPAPPSKVP